MISERYTGSKVHFATCILVYLHPHYYCEYAHLLKKCMEHTCMSAIYYDQGSDIKVKQCKTIVTFDTILVKY